MISSTVPDISRRSSYPIASNITVIPAQAGIHRAKRPAPPTSIDLLITYWLVVGTASSRKFDAAANAE
jgi:hypothetical protein